MLMLNYHVLEDLEDITNSNTTYVNVKRAIALNFFLQSGFKYNLC